MRSKKFCPKNHLAKKYGPIKVHFWAKTAMAFGLEEVLKAQKCPGKPLDTLWKWGSRVVSYLKIKN